MKQPNLVTDPIKTVVEWLREIQHMGATMATMPAAELDRVTEESRKVQRLTPFPPTLHRFLCMARLRGVQVQTRWCPYHSRWEVVRTLVGSRVYVYAVEEEIISVEFDPQPRSQAAHFHLTDTRDTEAALDLFTADDAEKWIHVTGRWIADRTTSPL